MTADPRIKIMARAMLKASHEWVLPLSAYDALAKAALVALDSHEGGAARSQPYTQGRRNGVKWAIAWLYKHAGRMQDPHAQRIINGCADGMGNAAREGEAGPNDKLRALFDAYRSIRPSQEPGE